MRTSAKHQRPAYTILEILLVLLLVVAFTSLSIPVAQTMLTESRISASADMVRARLSDTCSKALDEGRPWKLACQPSSGVFQLAPEDSSAWSNTADKEPASEVELIRDVLPQDIIFAMTPEAISGSSSTPSAESAWQTLAIYTADGSARDDQTFYFGRPGLQPIRVSLRGLTGAVSIVDANIWRAEPR